MVHDRGNERKLAGVANALSNSVRVQIIQIIASQPECAGREIFSGLPLAQSTVSAHLKVLREAGLIDSHAIGTATIYCLNVDVLDEFAAQLATLAANARGAQCKNSRS